MGKLNTSREQINRTVLFHQPVTVIDPYLKLSLFLYDAYALKGLCIISLGVVCMISQS